MELRRMSHRHVFANWCTSIKNMKVNEWSVNRSLLTEPKTRYSCRSVFSIYRLINTSFSWSISLSLSLSDTHELLEEWHQFKPQSFQFPQEVWHSKHLFLPQFLFSSLPLMAESLRGMNLLEEWILCPRTSQLQEASRLQGKWYYLLSYFSIDSLKSFWRNKKRKTRMLKMMNERNVGESDWLIRNLFQSRVPNKEGYTSTRKPRVTISFAFKFVKTHRSSKWWKWRWISRKWGGQFLLVSIYLYPKLARILKAWKFIS